jgi:transposase
MSLWDSLGITKKIDDACEWDRKQRVLSPGMALKSIAGTMFTENPKQAMHNVSLFYSGSPPEMLFGSKVTDDSLSDSALGRALETVFKTDTEELFCSICAGVKAQIGTDPRMYHFDPTNVTVSRSPGEEYKDVPENAPIPKLGRPKDADERGNVQYNVSCAVDEFGMPAYVRTYDGNTDDTRMISDAVRFVEKLLGDKRMIAVGDGKMVHRDLVDHMCTHGTHFVSKPPMNFAGGVREKVVGEAFGKKFVHIGAIGSRKKSPVFEACDIDANCNGRDLRFIVYRRTDREKQIRHMKRVEGKLLEEASVSLAYMTFPTEKEAHAAYREAIKGLAGRSYDIKPTFRSRRSVKYGNGTEWKATFKSVFNQKAAEKIAAEDVGVIITSLLRPDAANEDPAASATAYDVMRIYFGQWKIENLFGTMKSGMGADNVFFQNPQREAVMIFIIALAALVRSVVKMRLRSERGKEFGVPRNITTERMLLLTQNVRVKYDRTNGRIYLDGSPKDRERALSFADALDIDPVALLG